MSLAPAVVFPLAGYTLGSIPFGLLVARARGVDIRKVGSGNIGTTNVLRSQGKAMALLTLLLDVGKGFGPAFAAARVAGGTTAAVTGAACVTGHCFPVFLKGKGGKGVATGLGVFLALAPGAAVLALGVFIMVVAWKRYVSVGSMTAALLVPFGCLASGRALPTVAAAALAAALIVGRHYENVLRLLRGTERRVGEKAAA
ncbi:MAG: glycerol-3-phosphate 1-O-acyltransferase PlsY [Acidobacteriota bacterium]